MHALKLIASAAATMLAAGCAMMDSQPTSGPLKLVSDTKLAGPFVFPESVGCDPVRAIRLRR